jgi:hypothetical protein
MPPMRSLILPALGYLGYPMAVAGAVLVFGTCSVLTLDMISRNMGQVVAPVALSPDFNVPAVEQIGSIEPPAPEQAAQAKGIEEPQSSIVAVAPPTQAVAVTLAAPEADAATFETVEPPGLGSGFIGGLAVNVRAAPSKTGAKIGVLNAGSAVRIGENVDGWIHVFFSGGDGWVYQTYLAGG